VRALAFRRLVIEESRRLSLRSRSLLVRLLSSTLEELGDSWMDERTVRAVGLVYLADDFGVAGNGRKAREKLGEAAGLLDTQPSDPEAWATYYEVAADIACAEEEDLEQALTCLAKAEELLRDYPIAERLAETLLRRGLTEMRIGEHADAVEAFGAALRAVPAGTDSRLRLEALHHGAVAEMKRGDHAAAERLLAEAEPLYDRHSSARIQAQRAWLWGVLHLRARRVSEAQSAFWEALHLYQDLGPAGELAEMLVHFEKLCALTGDLDALDVVRARLSELASRTEPVN
jgi:tetratricopeptide (TPR) repeat protein